MDHYLVVNRDTPYQPYVQERNTMTQAALVLRMIRDDDSGSMRYYLPDPSVPEVQGGFNYGVNLNRVDFARALSRVVLFSSEGDLARKLAAQRDGLPAVAYLSVCTRPDPKDVKDAVDPLKAPLLGHDPEVIHPFEEVYRIRFLVRRFLLRPPRLQ